MHIVGRASRGPMLCTGLAFALPRRFCHAPACSFPRDSSARTRRTDRSPTQRIADGRLVTRESLINAPFVDGLADQR